jgi:glycosyltransferase involved in cell wall biosynthesis
MEHNVTPKISVVVPCYNSVRFIEETLRSIIDQDYPIKEIIVVDGGSSDGTLDILQRYGDRLKWV